MKTMKRLFATMLLAMALGATVHAGDMDCPPLPPPDHITAGVTSPVTDGQENQTPTASDTGFDVSTVAIEVLWDLLSMY